MEGVEGQEVGHQSNIQALPRREVRAMKGRKLKDSPVQADRMRVNVAQLGPSGNKWIVRGTRVRSVQWWVQLLLQEC
jgi:hypothetical protein